MNQRINSVDDVSTDIAQTIRIRGGLYSESAIEDEFYKHLFGNAVGHFAHLAKVTTELYYEGSGRKLKFGIINTTMIGAFACIGEGDIDFVGIHFGTISLVSALFTRMMSNPNILPTVGDATLETNGGYTHFIPAQEDLANFSPSRPACPIRVSFSKFLVLTGLDFIFGHEITHITRGHLGLLKRTDLSDPESLRRKLSHLENHALELDADCGASQMTLDYAARVRSWRHKLPVEDNNSLGFSWREFYANEFKTIEYCFFASYLTLRMTSPDCWDVGTQQRVHQPLPPYRMGTLMQAYVTALMQTYDISPKVAHACVFKWCVKSEQALADLLAESGKGELQMNAIESFFKGIGDYNEKVVDAHEILENNLSEFAMKEVSHMTLPRPRDCDYVVLIGMAGAKEFVGILEANQSASDPNGLDLQCFFWEGKEIKNLSFSLKFDSRFEGDMIGQALASSGMSYVARFARVTSFETVRLQSILEKTDLLRFSLKHSKCWTLKADLIFALGV